jgi:hypothetical protein
MTDEKFKLGGRIPDFAITTGSTAVFEIDNTDITGKVKSINLEDGKIIITKKNGQDMELDEKQIKKITKLPEAYCL